MLVVNATAAPIVVKDALHTIQLPTAPHRIVVLEFSFLDILASIGITPVGVADDGDPKRVLPRARESIGSWTSVGLRSQPNIEVIATLKPDLIIADIERHKALLPALSAIAPTLMLPSLGEDYPGTIASAKLIGQALNEENKMDKRLLQNQQKLASIAKEISMKDRIVVSVASGDGFSVHGPHSYAGSVLTALGLNVQSVSANAKPTEYISLEQLLAINPDWIFVGNYVHPSIVDKWQKLPLWSLLNAVKKHHIVDVDGNVWGRDRGIMASEQIAEDTLHLIRASH